MGDVENPLSPAHAYRPTSYTKRVYETLCGIVCTNNKDCCLGAFCAIVIFLIYSLVYCLTIFMVSHIILSFGIYPRWHYQKILVENLIYNEALK